MITLFALLALVAVVALFFVRSKLDVTAVLTAFLLALFAINARWIIPGGGAVATPAMAIAVSAAWWWTMARLHPNMSVDRGRNPVRHALLFYLWFVVLSWGLARLRPLSTLEVNGSNSALIEGIGLTGLALLITDGVETEERLVTLLRRLVYAGAAFSLVGILQFVFRFDLVALISFPGLVRNAESAQALATRAGLSRAEGTGLHSIEFGVVLAVILPLAVYFLMSSQDRSTRWRFVVITAVIGAGIPLSVARSGLVALAAALLVASLAWNWRERIIGALTAAVGMLVLGILVPGLLGTFRYFFLAGDDEASVRARLERIPLVEDTVVDAPWFGSGIGTFSPDEDFLLDNAFFGTILETGLLGLIVLLTMLGIAVFVCRRIALHSVDDQTRYLAYALMAGIVVLPVSMATFDAFFYRILMGVSFLLIGAAGALWRITVRDATSRRLSPDLIETQMLP